LELLKIQEQQRHPHQFSLPEHSSKQPKLKTGLNSEGLEDNDEQNANKGGHVHKKKKKNGKLKGS
jgi:hypothetical protein